LVFPCQLPSHTYAHMHMHTHIPVLLDKKTESVRVIQMCITVHIQVVVTLHSQTVTTATSRMDQILHSNDPPPPGQINGVRLNCEPSKYMSPTTCTKSLNLHQYLFFNSSKSKEDKVPEACRLHETHKKCIQNFS